MKLPVFKRFWNDRDRIDMVACGAAAGVAAAFRSPVGGVLFALEEMMSWCKNQILWQAFFTTAGRSRNWGLIGSSVRFSWLCVEFGLGFFQEEWSSV